MSGNYDDQNVFMKIIRKEASAVYVYEDDLTIAIMDIMPDKPGHVLIIPRYPAKDIFDVPQESINQIMFVSKKIAIACKKAFQADGIKIMQLNGFFAGQRVPHLHFHIIPCKNENNTIHKNIHSEKKIEKLETLESNAQKIRKELSAII